MRLAKAAPKVAPVESNFPFIVPSYVLYVTAFENVKIFFLTVCTQRKLDKILDKPDKELVKKNYVSFTTSFSVMCTRP